MGSKDAQGQITLRQLTPNQKVSFGSDSALINFGFVCLINLLIARPSIQISRTAPTSVNAENINPDKLPVCSQLRAVA